MGKIRFTIIVLALCLLPMSVQALTMAEITPGATKPQDPARSVVVIDQVTGEVLYNKNGDAAWIPASLTKLVTALVVLDTKPNWNGLCAVRKEDEVGGARLATYAGAKYRMRDLFDASLVASANNATNTLARCTGLSGEEFVKRMNAKALEFGALHTKFVEPTGIDIANSTTASDFAKIANGALSTKTVRDTLLKKAVTVSTIGSSPKKTHYLKTTNALLKDTEVLSLGGKTGYLDESMYNFAGSFKNPDGRFIISVVLGSPTKAGSFAETKSIIKTAQNPFAWQSFVASNPFNRVLGATN